MTAAMLVYRCPKCAKKLFYFGIDARGPIEIQCSRSDCKALNVFMGVKPVMEPILDIGRKPLVHSY